MSIYKKTYPRSEPEPIVWARPVVDALMAKYAPVWQSQCNAFQTPSRPLFDARLQAQFVQAIEYIVPLIVIAATTAQYLPPILQSTQATFRTPDGLKLDVRLIKYEEDTASWVQNYLNPSSGPSASKYIPPISQAMGSFRTGEKPVDTRLYQDQRPNVFGIPFDPALLQGIFTSQANTFVTPAKATLNVRAMQWNEDINFINIVLLQGLLQKIAPVLYQQSYQSYRTVDKPALSVPYYSWTSTDWIYKVAAIAIPVQAAPGANQLSTSFMTGPGKTPAIQQQTWDMNQGWIQYVTTLAPTPTALRSPADVTWYRNFS